MDSRFRPPADWALRATAVDVSTSNRVQLPAAANQPFSVPSASELALMAAWNIAFDGRAFCFAGYRYKRLADAMNDARRATPGGARTETTARSLP